MSLGAYARPQLRQAFFASFGVTGAPQEGQNLWSSASTWPHLVQKRFCDRDRRGAGTYASEDDENPPDLYTMDYLLSMK